MSHPRRRRLPAPTRAALLLCVLSLLALAGCGGDEPGAGEPSASVAPPTVSPLTGLGFDGDAPPHPVVAVKVDNSVHSAPQVGLGSADMVVEELVEGGVTRLVALYYTELPEHVGPVRSMRATDIGVVQPLGAVLVASGGAARTVVRVADAGIATVTEEEDGFYREPGRRAPYNLFVELPAVVGDLRPTLTPEPYLPFGPGLPQGEPATELTVTFSPSSSTAFEHRDGRYEVLGSRAAAGDDFTADTVLVLRVQVSDAGYRDPSGAFVPESRFNGRGHAMIFHDGRVVEADWIKNGYGAPVQLVQGDQPVEVPSGRVRVELMPDTTGSVSVTG